MALCTWPQMQEFYDMAGVKESWSDGWFYTGTSCGGGSYKNFRFSDLWEQCRVESEEVVCGGRYWHCCTKGNWLAAHGDGREEP